MLRIFLVSILLFNTNVFAEDLKKVYFGGGCFWCMEESFDKAEGVKDVISGYSGNKDLMEILELKNHPWYLASQFHPEFTSSPMKGHPLFNSFIKTAYDTK